MALVKYKKESQPGSKRNPQHQPFITLSSIFCVSATAYDPASFVLFCIIYCNITRFRVIHYPSTKMVRITLAVLACKSHRPYTVEGYMFRLMLTHCSSVAVSVMALAPNNAGAKDVGNGQGQQFTTGGCVDDADCRSACCAEIGSSNVGICSAVGAQFQNTKQGCGFVDPDSAVRTVSPSVLCDIY